MLIFCPETYNQENDLNVRVFAGYYGVPEDPGTGSANGCLSGYLLKYAILERGRSASGLSRVMKWGGLH